MTKENLIVLVIGLAGGFFLNLMANLLHPALLGFLGRGKEKELHKQRVNEWKVYKRVKALHDGRTDKYFFYLFWGVVGVFCMVALAICVIVGFLIAGSPTLSVAITGGVVNPYELLVGVGILAALGAAVILGVLYDTGRKVQNFSDYEKQVRDKWGLPD